MGDAQWVFVHRFFVSAMMLFSMPVISVQVAGVPVPGEVGTAGFDAPLA